MAEVGGLLASPVLRMAGNKLGSIIAEQANMQWNFTRDMEDMKETLETLEATLEDAEKRSINEKEVQLWLKRLKNAGLDIYDMFDDFHATMTQPTGKMPGMLSRFALASKMKNMRGTLRKIAEEHNTYKFSEVTSASTDQQQNDPRETTSDVNEGDIVGRNREKQEIIDLLSASGINKGTMILPIYGLGGIGKTTLASLVFSDNKFKEYDHRVWVYVSQVFDLKKIGRSIISRLSKQGSQQSTETMESINRCLDGLLHDKILIVLDDIWEKKDSELEKLKRMLRVGKKGSMIDVIVTTREEVIARKISNIEPYKLQPLKEQMCWNIIKKISDFESKANKEQLREIGLDVAKKCEGVALAAQALGYTLRFKDLRGWSEVKDSGIWNELINDEVLPSLKLSYKNMPRHLRLCFVYCAIFPKGRNIVKDDLIHQWIALDLIKPSTRDGEEYIKQLLGMSFLQHSKLSSTSQQPAVFTMHDLVHDLARSVMGDELFVYERGNSCEQKYCRYALLTNYSGPTKLSAIFPAQVRAQVRALHFLDYSELELRNDAFSFAKCLRVLDLSGCPLSKLPECVTRLSRLQYLNLHGSWNISALPESIGKIERLIHLDLSRCFMLVELPESLGNLKSLLHLELSYCSRVVAMPKSFCGLTKLQYLNLSNCSNLEKLPEDIGSLTKLQYLDFSDCFNLEKLPEAIGSLTELQHLNLSGCCKIGVLPESFGKLHNLVHLDLSSCRMLVELPESLGNLKSLVHLELSDCSRVVSMPKSFCGLAKLQYLNFSKCINLDKLPEAIGSLTELQHLNLSGCCKIGVLPESFGKLHSLVHLNLSSCRMLVELPESLGNLKSLLHLELSDCSRVVAMPKSFGGLTKLQYLNLSNCSNLEKLPEAIVSLTELKHLDFSNCFNLEKLPEAIESLTELQYLNFSNCSNLEKLPESWLMSNFPHLPHIVEFKLKNLPRCNRLPPLEQLPNLVKIELENLPRCNHLPPLGQLPNLEELHLERLHSITKVDGDFCGGRGAFRRLSTFALRNMERLEEWSTTYSGEDGVEEFMFPKLQRLCIWRCHSLRLKPCPPIFSTWLISDSDKVIYSWGAGGHISVPSSTPATTLEVHDSKVPKDKWRLLHHIPTLQKLEINQCDYLVSLPESMRHLTSLRSLELKCYSAVGITVLPEWMGDLTSLESLEIYGCNRLKSLPQCVQQLAMLNKIKITGNYDLRKWCESDENKMKLAHIEDISYANCDPVWYSLSNNDSISLHLFMSSDVNTCGNLHQLEDVNLNELQIYCLEDVRFLEEARKIKLLDRQSLSKLTLEWTLDDDRILEDEDVLGELVPPGGLQYLKLDGYNSINFPTWLMGISQYLPNLVEIVLENLPRCKNLPPLRQLPNLEVLHLTRLHGITKIDGDFCGGRGAFLRLSTFCLEDMERLEAWNTTYCGEDGMEEFMFPKLDRLYIVGCPKLRLTPRPPIFCSWTIEKSDEVISSWSEEDHVSHSPSDSPGTRLEVWYSEVPVGQWRLLHHLPTLQELNIVSCDKLTSLPENMQHLESLQSLELYWCRGISALPEWLGHLSSLEILKIQGCPRIKSLPQCIQQLTKLKKLRIMESLELKWWYESEDNKKKLAHIKHIELGNEYSSHFETDENGDGAEDKGIEEDEGADEGEDSVKAQSSSKRNRSGDDDDDHGGGDDGRPSK